jgi:hypothetical protein
VIIITGAKIVFLVTLITGVIPLLLLFVFGPLGCFSSELMELLGRVISLKQDRYLHRTTQTQNERGQHICLERDSKARSKCLSW